MATFLLAAALTSGCASYNRDHVIVGSVPDDYRTNHPIIVSEKQIAEDIVIPANAGALSQRDLDVVRDTGLAFRESGSSSIAILVPTGSRNAHAARKAAHQAVAELKSAGIPAAKIRMHNYDATNHGEAATLRLVFSDLTAEVDSKCGDWNEDITQTRENRNYRNFGCATQNNLAQMIADPADLLGPRGDSGIDPARRTVVIENWRANGTGG